jgi:hypothetical protein
LIWSRLVPSCELDINSPDQLKAALASVGIPLPDTKEVTLAALEDPISDLILEYRVGKCNGVGAFVTQSGFG